MDCSLFCRQSRFSDRFCYCWMRMDRCNNVSAMASAVSKEKMQRYIKETQDFIYPLFHSAQAHNPEYAPQILLVNYHLVSVVESLKQVLN